MPDRIETNSALNALSKAGGQATGSGLSVPVDASAIVKAGETAKTSGALIVASLDKTLKPVVDTSSIDAATEKAKALKAILGNLSGAISLDGVSGSGGSSGASAAVGKALGGSGGKGPAGGGGDYNLSSGQAIGQTSAALTAAARESWDFWKGKGAPDHVAAGLLGMEQGENNFQANGGMFKGWGDRGTAYGSFMWHKDRRDRIKRETGINVIGASHGQQLEAAYHEMTKGNERGFWDRVNRTKTPGSAAAAGVNGFERPKDRAGASRLRGGYANHWMKKFGGAAPAAAEAAPKPEPVALAGARAMGGPVQRGLSYLVGERGPEIFTPGATGGISTNDTLNRLAEVGSRTVPAEDGGGSRSIAPDPGTVAKLRPQGGSVSTRGDTHYAPSFHIHDASDPVAVRREVESTWRGFIREMEAEQRGLLSD